MAAFSKIEWTTHTSGSGLRVSPKFDHMREVMAADAKRDAVPSVEPQGRVIGKRPNVVSIEVPAAVIAAMGASESVAPVHIISPALQFGRSAQPATLNTFPVDIAWRIRAPWRALARSSADLRARLYRMSFPNTVARPGLRCRAHFSAAFIGHLGAA